MCNCYWYTVMNVHARFHMHMCYICYAISRRRLHKLVKLVSYPFCLYEQIQLLSTKTMVHTNIHVRILVLDIIFAGKHTSR